MRFGKNPLKYAIAAIVLAAGTSVPTLMAAEHGDANPPVKQNGKAMATVEDLSRAFRNVGQAVEPSVVNIKVRKVIENPHRRMAPGSPFNDPFFRKFFDQDGDGEPDMPFGDMPPGGEQIGQGSGVIVAVDGKTGWIVTNNHVAGDADEMQIVLNDGRTVENAKLVGADPKTDIAVVKIEADDLKPATWGDSDELQKGDWVLAFGSPFGYVGSMTHGVVSATNRTNMGIIPMGYESFIQIDAPINPGNSGGPLTNIRGEVVGINTAIASRTGGFQGIGFAIPSNQAKQIYSIIRDKGKVVRGWLGVTIASVSDPEAAPIAKDMGFEGKKGVLVQEVRPNEPAFGKLQNGDIITKLNGKSVADVNELRNTIAMTAPGTNVKVEVFRNGKTQDVDVKLGDQPTNLAAAGQERDDQGQQEPADGQGPKLGVSLRDLSPDIARQFGLRRDVRGAVITRVVPGSIAMQAGLRPGVVITKVGNQNVTTADEAIAALGKADLAKGVRLYVVSAEGGRFVFVQAPKNGGAKKGNAEREN